MTIGLFMAALCLVAMAAAVFFFWNRTEADRRMQETVRQIIDAQKKDQSLEFLQRELANLREQMAKSLNDSARLMTESQKTVGDRLDKAAEVVGNVQRALGALDKATNQVYLVGKDIAQLQEILRAPKLRGSLGELFLGDLLAQILPTKNFTLQHMFKTGEAVDA